LVYKISTFNVEAVLEEESSAFYGH